MLGVGVLVPYLMIGWSWGTTWVVDPSDSSAQPDISTAILNAVSGDRIEVTAGTYQECLDTDGKDLDVEGLSGSASTFLEGTKECVNAWSIQGGETVSITGFEVTHGNGRGLLMNGSHAQLVGCSVVRLWKH